MLFFLPFLLHFFSSISFFFSSSLFRFSFFRNGYCFRFEPFSILTVPLPEERNRNLAVHVLQKESIQAMKVSISVAKEGSTLQDVIRAVDQSLSSSSPSSPFSPSKENKEENLEPPKRQQHFNGIDGKNKKKETSERRRWLVVEVHHSRIRQVYTSLSLSIDKLLRPDLLWLLEIEASSAPLMKGKEGIEEEDDKRRIDDEDIEEAGTEEEKEEEVYVKDMDFKDLVRVIFVHRRPFFESNREDCCLDGFTLQAIGHPFILLLPSTCSKEKLYSAVYDRVKTLLKEPVESLFFEDKNKCMRKKKKIDLPPTLLTDRLLNRSPLFAREGENDELLGDVDNIPSRGFYLR